MQRLKVVGILLMVAGALCAPRAYAQAASGQFEPQVGQPGKDVVWVPTPEVLVERMLDMAKVTPQDLVMDLGSGDGRNIIAAAKRGARAIGVEYNPEMVALSRRIAQREGVADRAQFVEGDMFVADISRATVLALFLLPDNMVKLRDKFVALRPGSRIVANTFGIEGWEPDEQQQVGDGCQSWCTALLWIVPAQIGGTWRLPQGELRIDQTYQMIAGSLTTGGTSVPIEGRLRGTDVTFTVGNTRYAGTVREDGTLRGTASPGGAWTATRVTPSAAR